MTNQELADHLDSMSFRLKDQSDFLRGLAEGLGDAMGETELADHIRAKVQAAIWAAAAASLKAATVVIEAQIVVLADVFIQARTSSPGIDPP